MNIACQLLPACSDNSLYMSVPYLHFLEATMAKQDVDQRLVYLRSLAILIKSDRNEII